MFDTPLAWLFIPTAAVLGWALGRRSDAAGSGMPPGSVPPTDAIAVDESDTAMTALTRAIEAAPGAIELQLNLGALFRRRGEIERAIRLHESLLARPDLAPDVAAQARLGLAWDYLAAGVLDRAETLAQSLVDSGSEAAKALELLLRLYEQARDWPQAIATAQRWQAVRGQSAAVRIAQYHCEEADTLKLRGSLAEAAAEAVRALAEDAGCVRAGQLLGAIEEARKSPGAAWRHYRRALESDPRYAGELIEAAQRCAVAAGEAKAFAELLDDLLRRPAPPPAALIAAKACWLAESGEADSAVWLADRLAERPQFEGALLWLKLSGNLATSTAWPPIEAALLKRFAASPRYACSHCGLQHGLLYWQCPACRSWATVMPRESAF